MRPGRVGPEGLRWHVAGLRRKFFFLQKLVGHTSPSSLSLELLDGRAPTFAGSPALVLVWPRGRTQNEWVGGWWMGPLFSEAALGVAFIHLPNFLHLVEQEKRNGSVLAPL